MTLQRINPGDRFRPSATAWNAAMDATEDYLRRRPGAVVGSIVDNRSQLVYVRNDTGEDLDQFSVVGVQGAVISPSENQADFTANPYLVGVVPTSRHVGNFAITQEPIPDGKFGRAIVAGWSHAWLKPASSGDYAEVISGDTDQLQQGDTGSALILYIPTAAAGSDAVLGMIRFGGGTASVKDTQRGVDVWGCHPWDCTSDASSFAAVSCGACTTTPDFFAFAMPVSCTCCDGRAASPDSSQPGLVVLQRTTGSSCIYESAPFSCQTGGASCGTAQWKWTTSGGYCGTQVWRTRLTAGSAGCGYEQWQWTGPLLGWNNITGDCGECGFSTEPPYDGMTVGDIVNRYCGDWEWYETGEGGGCKAGCETPAPPSDPPTEGAVQYITCPGYTEGGGDPDWIPLGSACLCGTTAKPKYPGDYDGQIVTVPCTGAGSGYDSQAIWRLTLGSSPHLDLVGPDAGVILRYDLKAGRTMCCECANIFEFTGPCGPFDCESFPDAVCIKPYWPPKDCTVCPDLPDEYSMVIDFFADHSDGNYNFATANGTFSMSKISEDAAGAIYQSPTFSMNFGATVKTCYWEARVQCLFGFTTGSVALIGYSEDLGGFAKGIWNSGNTSADGGHVSFYWAGPTAYDATNGPCRGGRYCSLDETPQEFELPIKNISISDNIFSGGGQTRTECGTTRDLFSGSDNPFFTDDAPRITLTPV